MVEFQYVDGSPGQFEGVLYDKHTIVLFAHFDCAACYNMLRDWHSWAGLNAERGVQIIVCIGQSPDEVAPELWDEMIDDQVVFVDRKTFLDRFNLRVWPTIVCVDQFALVTALQLGYNGQFTEDIARCLR